MERVIITGSHLRRSDTEPSVPVQTFTREDIRRSGKTTVSDLLRGIPADNNGSLTQAFGGFAGGASGISLRGLTLNATLVLIDGRRMAPYPLADDGQRHFVDLSSIPLSIIERIEILKDGASAIYGSDAIAGVVNIILTKDFGGAEGQLGLGTSYKGDGNSQFASATYGFGSLTTDGRNAYFNIEFRHQEGILQRSRRAHLSSLDLRAMGGPDLRGGIIQPANAPPSNFANTLVGMVAPLDAGGVQAGPFQLLPGCAPQNLNYSGGCTWDTLQYTQIQPATRNLNLFGRLTQDLGSGWQARFDAGLFSSRPEQTASTTWVPQQTQTDPSTSNVVLPVGHPDNPFGPANRAFLYHAFGDVGPRHSTLSTKLLRLVGSISGPVADWELSAGAGFVKGLTDVRYEGHVRTSVLAELLESGSYRIGANAVLNSPELYARLAPVTHSKASSTLSFVDFKASRDVTRLPGGPLAFVVGAEARRTKIDNPGQPFAAEGDLQGTLTAYAKGSQEAYAGFVELGVPVAKSIDLALAVRHDRYPSIADSTVPKVGLKWTPVPMLSLRGTYSKGFRVPGIAESGDSSVNAFTTFSNADRCPFTNLPSDCIGPILLALASNPILKPEKSTGATLGFVFKPSKTTSVSLDYYQIRRANEIVTAPFSSAEPIFGGPDLANPNLPPPIVGFSLPFINANSSRTSGIDIDLRQRLAFNGGSALTLSLLFSRILELKQIIAGTTYDFADTHGPTSLSGNVGTPANRGTLSVFWERGPLVLGTQVYYVGSMAGRDPVIGDSCLMLEASPRCRIGSFASVDLSASYRVQSGLELMATVQNAFNRLPPLDTITYGGINYNPSLHQAGAIGRFFQVGARYRF